MKPSRVPWPEALWLVGLLSVLGIVAGGCAVRPLIYDVSVSPAAISPNADGSADVTRIEYSRALLQKLFADGLLIRVPGHLHGYGIN